MRRRCRLTTTGLVDTPIENLVDALAQPEVRNVTTNPRPADTGRYVVRFELTPFLMVFLPLWWEIAVASLAAGIWFSQDLPSEISEGLNDDTAGWWVGTACCVSMVLFFGTSASAWTIAVATKQVALCVDRDGVTLGRTPFPPRRAVTVPWADLRAIVIYRRLPGMPGAPTLTCLGLRLRPNAVRPRGVPRPGSVRAWLNWEPAEVSRDTRGWWVDELQLRLALYAYAPHVAVNSA
jgi:hypothetical protein